MSDPVFLVAARRSGTTLFRLMLNGHPKVVWQRGWERVADAIDAFSGGSSEPERIALEDFSDFSVTSQSELKEELGRKIEAVKSDQNKTVFGATVHVGFKAMTKVWPSAKFVHLIRDPRDIAISHVKLGWSGHYYFGADPWTEAERDWETLSPSLSDDQYINLKYEELVAHPEAELKRVCEFLNLDYTDKLFDYVNTSSYSHPKKELAYRWKQQLDDEQVRLIESRIHPKMEARGYDPTDSPKRYSGFQVAKFKVRNTWTMRMKRIKEHGLSHVVMDKLARDLNLKFLKDRMAKAEIEKRKQHLSSLEKNY